MTLRERIEKLIGDLPTFVSPDQYYRPTMSVDTYVEWRTSIIDRLCESSKVVHTANNAAWWATPQDMAHDTHTAILLDIQPIQRGVTKEEIVNLLRGGCAASTCFESSSAKELADRIEREGIKP